MANTFKGTPWHVAETAPECPWVEVHGVNGLVICDAYDKPTGFLFAAAPDLLEAAVAMRAVALAEIYGIDQCKEMHDIDAAIAKALGDTNDA